MSVIRAGRDSERGATRHGSLLSAHWRRSPFDARRDERRGRGAKIGIVAELPGGTVTFLFTDIEGSTRLLDQLRDRYADVLAQHHRVLRRTFANFTGHEVDTQGDAFFVAFSRAGQAVAAAVAAQRALAEVTWPQGVDVRVRMGLDTGEPVVGDDRYVGLRVHRGARICSAGHGGQILLSSATRELVEDDYERTTARGIPQEAGGRVEEPEARSLTFGRRCRREIGK